MTQPIIRDSEDEDDEEFLIPEDNAASKPSQQSNHSWALREFEEILAQNPSQGLDGMNASVDQSSLSTGDLQRQIADASRGLFDSTSDQQATLRQGAMAPNSTPGIKKRRSKTVESGSSAKTVKRTKTGIVTYGSGKTNKSNRTTEADQFDAFRDDLPVGTLQTHFANHEPVMFRGTGSTVVDNESSQQRMIEQSLNHRKQLSGQSENKPDSSFPWPKSSTATETPKDLNRASKQSPHDEPRGAMEPGKPCETGSGANNIETESTVSTRQPLPAISQEAMPDDEIQAQAVDTRPLPNSSPQVSVPRIRVKSNTAASATKGRKRKASASDLEPLNSEDLAIGHPKELYQPRLSRRRATGIVPQPEDYSVVPEKAAKKRRKTVNTASAPLEVALDERVASSDFKKSGAPAASISGSSPKIKTSEMIEKPQPAREEIRAVLKDLNFPLTNTSFDAVMPGKPSPTKDASPLSAKKAPATTVFAVPAPASSNISVSPTPTKRLSKAAAASAMPPPTSSVSRKSRRSQTTIFEDHVEFGGSQQRSPSLRQQQESRKQTALAEVTNITAQGTRRKRRTILQDDEDDEDELTKDHADEVVAPKQRGRPTKAPAGKRSKPTPRGVEDAGAESEEDEIVQPPKKKGRPAKAPAGKAPKSAERVLEDSEVEVDERESEIEERPKKRAGRRPSKASAGSRAGSETLVNVADGDAAEGDAAEYGSYSTQRPSTVQAPPASTQPTPTPPSKQTPPQTTQAAASKSAVQPALGKPAAATHSPIKPSSKVLHRVGLNRKQRVQPLLKMVKPPPPAKPPAPGKSRKTSA